MQMAIAAIAMLAAALPAQAQDRVPTPGTITVQGTGIAKTPPDIATIAITINSQGKTADEATSTLVAKQKKVLDGLRGVLKGAMTVETGNISLEVIRAGACSNDYNMAPRVETGPCAVAGYSASLDSDVITSAVADAATAAGYAAQLGATNAKVQSYGIKDQAAAQRIATKDAIANALVQAQAIATGSGMTLGKLISVSLPEATPLRTYDVVSMDGVRNLMPAPVTVQTTPATIETRVRLTVVYAIAN